MIESFVDLTYRGLALGRRVKLTQVRPSTGYLEMPTPMPVGTQLVITTDEGVALEAVVTHIHEQVGGSERVPGMIVRPALPDATASAWWQARVALPEAPVAHQLERGSRVTVRPRSQTVQAPPSAPDGHVALSTEVTATKELSVYVAEQAPAAEPRPASDAGRTTVMPAVDQELLAELMKHEGGGEHLVRRTGEHAVVDDGLRTMVMDAIDPAALGLDTSASGPLPAASSSGGIVAASDDESGEADKSKDTPGVKKRKKRR
ncbi:MAG: hypothetical protein M3680_02620 [Myxococcota bacterium]|nr:hypothetical protein [Myxococcota bacterium]